ncbi:MAG: peptidoglycan-binding protein [Anaerolineaceae bacterium]|nr:peptidoglycan-binding protein [Anaerolineaceae bacterium]
MESVEKARIVDEKNPSRNVVCHFNPKELSITQTINYESNRNIGNNAANLSFSGGEAQDLTIPLLFDSTATGADVRDSYKILLELATIDDKKKNSTTEMGEPPYCRFEWGKLLSFRAVITKLTQKFLMFKTDGLPLRAEVSVTFKQVDKKPTGQNPTSRTESRKIWIVHEGQSLDWIAYQEYGDPAYWRHIAETNQLANPMVLQPGQILKLTPLA